MKPQKRPNKPNPEKCAVLLMYALEAARSGRFEANKAIVEKTEDGGRQTVKRSARAARKSAAAS